MCQVSQFRICGHDENFFCLTKNLKIELDKFFHLAASQKIFFETCRKSSLMDWFLAQVQNSRVRLITKVQMVIIKALEDGLKVLQPG